MPDKLASRVVSAWAMGRSSHLFLTSGSQRSLTLGQHWGGQSRRPLDLGLLTYLGPRHN